MIYGFFINFVAFLVIAELLPGFKVRTRGTAAIMALVYSFLNAVAIWSLVGVTITFVTMLIAMFPPLGILAGAGAMVAWVVIPFFVSLVSLVVTDMVMEDFEMKSYGVALFAAILLSVISVITGSILGV